MTRSKSESTRSPSVGAAEDLGPRLSEDASCVVSGAIAAMRPDRNLLGWLLLMGVVVFGAVWDAADGDRRPASTWVQHTQSGAQAFAEALIDGDVEGLGTGILGFVVEPTMHAWSHDRSFVVIAALLIAALVAILGTAIIRIDVLRLVADLDVGIGPAMRQAAHSWRRSYGTLILAPVLALVLLLPIVVVGGVAAIPGISFLLSLLWGILLVPAFAAALVIFGWLVSLPILSGAMALEAGDPVENVIRSFVLIRRRPVRFVILLLGSLVALLVGWLIVSAVVAMTVNFLDAASGFLFAATPAGPVVTWPGLASVWPGEDGPRGWSDSLVGFWTSLVVSLAWAWSIAATLQFSGRAYLVLRRAVERLPLDELDDVESV